MTRAPSKAAEDARISSEPARPGPGQGEFIALMALLMATVALAIDIVLPGFQPIAEALAVENPNDRQWIITCVFLGLAVGQFFFGPLSDSIGRRPAIFLGVGLFTVGGALCVFATSFEMLLAGRVLQGIGAAGPRIVTVAMVRDRFAGVAMGRIMSFIITIFILVPMLAPSLGQAVLWVAGWRELFAVLTAICIIAGVWLALRQPETIAQKAPFSMSDTLAACREVLGHRKAMAYMFASGISTGPLVGYLSSSQQIFQDLYGVGDWFALHFSLSAGFIAMATLINARLLKRWSMEAVCKWSMTAMTGWSLGFVALISMTGLEPGIWEWQMFNCVCLFLLGLTFGNMGAVMLEPLGHIAGTASALTTGLSSLLCLVIGAAIGFQFDMSVGPMAVGYLGAAAASLMFLLLAETRSRSPEPATGAD